VNKYTRLFIDESRVYVPGIASILCRLREGCPEELDLREGQRLAHSIKGMALFEQQSAIAAVAWAMERAFERLSGGGAGGSALVTLLEAAVPVLARLIDEVADGGATRTDPPPEATAIESAL
jgi:chemotaxis protein histidine kinase CheA